MPGHSPCSPCCISGRCDDCGFEDSDSYILTIDSVADLNCDCDADFVGESFLLVFIGNDCARTFEGSAVACTTLVAAVNFATGSIGISLVENVGLGISRYEFVVPGDFDCTGTNTYTLTRVATSGSPACGVTMGITLGPV